MSVLLLGWVKAHRLLDVGDAFDGLTRIDVH